MNENPFMPIGYNPDKTEVESLDSLNMELKKTEELKNEAKKLGTTIEEINKSIESYGGLEKFKEKFETPYSSGSNPAYYESRTYDSRINQDKEMTRFGLGSAALCAGIAAIMVYIADNDPNLSEAVKSSGIIEKLSETKEGGLRAVLGVFGSLSVFSAAYGFTKLYDKRGWEIEKKIKALEFKVAGVEIKEPPKNNE